MRILKWVLLEFEINGLAVTCACISYGLGF